MEQTSPRVLIVVSSIVAATAAVIGVLAPGVGIPQISVETLILAGMLYALIVCADFFEIDTPLASTRVTVSISAALCFASVITLGPLLGALVAGFSILTVEILQRTSLIKMLLNVTNYVASCFVGGYVYYRMADTSATPISDLTNLAATIVAALCFTLINSGIIAIVLSQVLGTSPFQIWRANAREATFEHISLPTIGVMVPVVTQESLYALIIVVVPLLGPYLAFRSYRQVHEETRATLNVLADMLDRRDPYTAEHSQRVSDMVSRMLAHYPGVSFEDSETIVTAARIHDLGKVTTSDATLLKPGRLEPEEFEEMKRHSQDGAMILGHITIYEETAKIIRHHHERWDGRGYPDGISGEEIPIGSRLIAVADTYDAMTTDRPYRKALPHCAAVNEIRQNAGSQFEPLAVEAFLEVISEVPEEMSHPVLQEIGSSD